MSNEEKILRGRSLELDLRWAPDGAFDLDAPSPIVLRHLGAIDLAHGDIELLFGDSPGFSASDVRKDISSLWFRTRARVTTLVCDDPVVRESVKSAISVGSAAVLSQLLSQLGIVPDSAASKILEPVAVGICLNGLNRLCPKAS